MADDTHAPEESPLRSKKFLAYLLAEGSWKVALLVVLIAGMKNAKIDLIVGGIAMAIVIVAGFIEAGYILGQASLDKYIRIAQIAASNGKAVSMKGMQVTPGKPPPEPPSAA